MFARIYTAAPSKLFSDMYENETSFDEAARNLYDQELEQGYDTASLDEFLEPGIEDFDETAVEKAIYQTAIAQEQGGNPVDVITTPYGSGLLQDEYDEIINIYPGIGAGVEWRTMDDHYHDAEDVFNDPGAGMAISNLVDTAVEKAEDEGMIDNLGDIFKAFGEQLGQAGRGVSEAHVAERTAVDPDTGDLFLGPSVGPNAPLSLLNNVEVIAGEMNQNAGQNVQTEAPPNQAWQLGRWGEYGDILDRIFANIEEEEPDKIIAEILGDLHNIYVTQAVDEGLIATPTGRYESKSIFQAPVFNAVVMYWMQDKSWEGKLDDAGLPESGITKLKGLIEDVLGRDGTGDTSVWSEDTVAETMGAISLEELNRNRAIQAILDKNPGMTLDDATETWEAKSPEEKQTTFEEIEAMAVSDSEMRTRHNRSLSRSFYETLYAQPWGGRSEFQSILPTMLSETKTLFFIAHAIPGVDGLTDRYDQQPPKEGDWGAEYKAGDDYKKFLRGYLQNPDAYRKGGWLAGRVKLINDLLQKKLKDPHQFTPEQRVGGTWTTDDQENWLWIQPLFAGDTAYARTNRYNLIKMVASQGKQGYMANIHKAGAMNAIQHYENMGLGDSEIFTMMTRIFGDTGGKSAEPIPIDPALGPKGVGYGRDRLLGTKDLGPAATGGRLAGTPTEMDDYEQDLLGQDDALAMEFDETAGVTDPDAVRDDVNAMLAGDAEQTYKKTSKYSSRSPWITTKPYVDKEEIYEELDPRLSYEGEPTELDRDIDRILSRSSEMQASSPRSALIQNRIKFHDETLDEATDWVDESMGTFPGQPDPSLLPGAERYAQFGVDPSLSRIDIEDILAGFDSGPSIRRPVPMKKKLPQDEIDQMMIDFGM